MFIKEYPHALTDEFCDRLVEKFEQDERKIQGITAGGVQLDKKRSKDLPISGLPEYEYEDKVFYDCLSHYSRLYLSQDFVNKSDMVLIDPVDSGYQIQKTAPGEFYGWHNDSMVEFFNSPYSRVLTYLWYLNTVEEGGETEFITGEKIKPETGKLLIFPATWNMIHQGLPPLNRTKYIATGWYYSKLNS